MRPDSSQDPSVEPMEEPADVGSFVILSPTPYERIQLLNQLLGGQRQLPPCPLSHLIHETTNRLRFGIRVKRSRTSSATNLAFGQTKLSVPALDFVAKELEAIPNMDDPRLLRVQFHVQLFQDSAGRFYCGSCLCRRFAGNHPVIGVSRELISSQPHLPIERRQKNVTEKRRNYPALWSATLARKEPSFTIASSLEHCLNEAKHSTICYSLGYQREELFVIHRPEEVSEICVHDPLRPALYLVTPRDVVLRCPLINFCPNNHEREKSVT